MMENISACPVCQNSQSVDIRKFTNHAFPGETYHLQVCRYCALQFLNPRPLQAEMGRYYPRLYYKLAGVDQALSPWKKMALSSWHGYPADRQPFIYRAFLGLIQPLLKGNIGGQIPEFVAEGVLLEVGCGRGKNLIKMRDLGWRVYGCDIGADALRFAQQQYGLPVCWTGADRLPYADGSFDAVLLRHVIEHLHYPRQAMAEIHRTLKPGGKLLITTPNSDSLGNSLFGSNWLHYDPPRHLMIYNQQSLTALLELSGFRLLSCHTPATNSAGLFRNSVSTKARRRPLFSVIKLLSRFYFLLLLGLACLNFKRGEEIQAVGLKEETAR